MLDAAGILGEYKGSQAREVMMTPKEYEQMRKQAGEGIAIHRGVWVRLLKRTKQSGTTRALLRVNTTMRQSRKRIESYLKFQLGRDITHSPI